jgi:hypothetical protein
MILLVEQCYLSDNKYYFVTNTNTDKCTYRYETIRAALQNAYHSQYTSPKSFTDIKGEAFNWQFTTFDITDIKLRDVVNAEKAIHNKYPELLL